MTAQVKVCVCGLGLLLPKLSGGPVSDDRASSGRMRKCVARPLSFFTYTADGDDDDYDTNRAVRTIALNRSFDLS